MCNRMNYRINEKMNRVSVKIYNNSKYLKSIIIPTDYYPTNSNNDFEVFENANTEALTNDALLNIIDDIEYKVGYCYTNTENIIELASKNNINLTPYCGWLFVGDELPVHHCWCMYGNSLIDLADDFNVSKSKEIEKTFLSFNTKEERWNYMADIHIKNMSLKNSERCKPIGKVHPSLLYIGSPCSPSDGRIIYNNLLKRYPNHEAERNTYNGMTDMQRIIYQKMS